MVGISELWKSRDNNDWRNALANYWIHPSVQKNLEVEQFIDKLDSESIRQSNLDGWLAFLRVYFHWKFNGTYLPQRLSDLERNDPERLLNVKVLLFTSNLSDIRRTLERARYIKGLGPAGASGLLAVLFPKQYATVDRFVVQSLLEIHTLPQRSKLSRMSPKSLTDADAVVLIGILREIASSLNRQFQTNEWTPRKIDMVLWTLRDGPQCS